MRHPKKSGRRASSRSACEALGDVGTLASMKAALKARDVRVGHVPQRTPFHFSRRLPG